MDMNNEYKVHIETITYKPYYQPNFLNQELTSLSKFAQERRMTIKHIYHIPYEEEYDNKKVTTYTIIIVLESIA
ncbi:hypothetical protein [Tissierella praeacuta]|uniref:hypothetical protein n=1 Tax=Tissierella praeacuta TaxID=43131 RepID=UPI003341EBF6